MLMQFLFLRCVCVCKPNNLSTTKLVGGRDGAGGGGGGGGGAGGWLGGMGLGGGRDKMFVVSSVNVWKSLQATNRFEFMKGVTYFHVCVCLSVCVVSAWVWLCLCLCLCLCL